MNRIKIGVLGAGHLGKIHLKILAEMPEWELTGFYDPNPDVARDVEASTGIPCFKSICNLIDSNDAIDIVVPTTSHFELASKALRKSKPVFIEKPVTNTVDEARTLMRLSEEAACIIQVGHVERFNPAFTAVKQHIKTPMFIEAHRLAQFNPRGTDVSVVSDLMIHDIDIVLSVVKSRVKKIHAGGVAVVSETPDICNARLEFENGCTANLTASRISMKNMRKMRFFQKDAYLSVDFLNRESEILSLKQTNPDEENPFAVVLDLGEGKAKKEIVFDKPTIQETNAIQEELREFHQNVLNQSTPTVSGYDALHALEVAQQILEKMKFTSGITE
jgi:predicted dehydrogenase